MKKAIAGLLALAITGALAIAAYAVSKSDGCVRLAVPSYLEFGYCPNLSNREFQAVYFESGKSEIPLYEHDKLYQLLDYLNKNKNRRVMLIGHTDRDLGINHEILSSNRANSIKLWLKNQGIEEERIKAYGKGHSNPVLGQNDLEDKSKSRRVEIEIR
jgi:OmpA-OmpF porin, OOP family